MVTEDSLADHTKPSRLLDSVCATNIYSSMICSLAGIAPCQYWRPSWLSGLLYSWTASWDSHAVFSILICRILDTVHNRLFCAALQKVALFLNRQL